MDEPDASATPVTMPTPATLDIKPGWRSTEFYITLLTAALPVLTAIFHQDFTAQVQSWAVIAATVASAAYAFSRAFTKHGAIHARSNVEAANATAMGGSNSPQQQSKGPESNGSTKHKPASTETTMAAVPLDTLATILARLDQLVANENAPAKRVRHRETAS